jgi:hypothetical protein
LLQVKATGDAAGQKIDLAVNVKDGLFALQVHGNGTQTTYEVALERTDAAGVAKFDHKGLAIGSSDVLLFDYAHWQGDKKPLGVAVDKNHDGKAAVEEEQPISDDN